MKIGKRTDLRVLSGAHAVADQSHVLTPAKGRACGPCNACCRTMPIVELNKPPGVRCSNLHGLGCGIYEDRPPACREYVCMWLGGFGTVEDRPDRLGAMLGTTANNRGVAVWLLDGRTPDNLTATLQKKIRAWCMNRLVVSVLYGDAYERTRTFRLDVHPDDVARDTPTNWVNESGEAGPPWWEVPSAEDPGVIGGTAIP